MAVATGQQDSFQVQPQTQLQAAQTQAAQTQYRDLHAQQYRDLHAQQPAPSGQLAQRPSIIFQPVQQEQEVLQLLQQQQHSQPAQQYPALPRLIIPQPMVQDRRSARLPMGRGLRKNRRACPPGQTCTCCYQCRRCKKKTLVTHSVISCFVFVFVIIRFPPHSKCNRLLSLRGRPTDANISLLPLLVRHRQ